MHNFYTSVTTGGGKILFRSVKNGKRVMERIDYSPSLFLPTNKETIYKDIQGNPLGKVDFDSITEAKDFLKSYKDVENLEIFGNTRFEYPFIAEQFPKEIEWDINKILIADLDIEVNSDNGFPFADRAQEEITAITLSTKLNGFKRYDVFGCKPYQSKENNIHYHYCNDELDMLQTFLTVWCSDYPDILTGWNVKRFDMVYLYNRISKLFGEKEAKRLSPWKNVYSRILEAKYGKTESVYVFSGLALLDYEDLYKKFAREGKSQESYKLDNISFVELGERKLDYTSYGNLNRLYKENYTQFIDYNIRDVDLVDRLEDKLKLIETAVTFAYDLKTNYEDVFTQVRMWTTHVSNELKKENVILNHLIHNSKDQEFAGAYVKKIIPGLYEYIVSFDFTSLYPKLIMQYNISPETLVHPDQYPQEIREWLSKNVVNVENLLEQKLDLSILKKYNLTMTPNAQFFRTDKQGFLPKIVEKVFDDRVKYKTLMLKYQDELELINKEKESGSTPELEKREHDTSYLIAKYKNLQEGKKTAIVSLYGVLGSEHFLLFDINQALAITSGGQLSVRWLENGLNNFLRRSLNTGAADDYVIAMDTDSIYLNLRDLVRKSFATEDKIDPTKAINFMDKVCINALQPEVNKCCIELSEYVNAFAQKMEMKREVLADIGIWTAPKHYILNVYDNEKVRYTHPKLKIMGMEAIKSSTPYICREKIKKVYDLVINADEATLRKFVADFKAEFKKQKPFDIAFPRGVNNLEKYVDKDTIFGKSTPMHVRGSLIYNHLLRKHKLEKDYETIKEGNKIKFIYLKMPNPIHSDTIAFTESIPKEFDISDYIDYTKQFDKTFLEAIKPVLDCRGWKAEKGSSSLFDFM